jgi:hypothetical protein
MDFSYFLDSRLRGNDTLSGNRILSGHYHFGFSLVREWPTGCTPQGEASCPDRLNVTETEFSPFSPWSMLVP